jgi:Abi-like protein
MDEREDGRRLATAGRYRRTDSARPQGHASNPKMMTEAYLGPALTIACGLVRIDPAWVSPERFAQYEQAANGDPDLASQLYEWNARAAAALFEIIHHFEVLLRNAIVSQIATDGQSPVTIPGSPWVQGAKQIQEVESRLKRRGKAITAGRVYSGLSFGFWQTMFGIDYEELWRHSLKSVFRHSRADRPVIAAYLESLNQIRNRIAHHGSLIELDVAVEAQKIVRLASWIDPDAAEWIKGIERVTEFSRQRPIAPLRNVVVVPAADAWNLYHNLHQNAYVFQAGRSIKLVDHLAFYADQEIKQTVPKILHWFDAVDWNTKNATRLAKSTKPFEAQLGSVIKVSKGHGWNSSIYQVFILSGPRDNQTIQLSGPINHSKRGRGSAFARGHRYHALAQIMSAGDTADLT